ncbi:MAG: hypothetical protein LDL07_14590, partial [Desulfarculus sp.]|nr:hypothetical protein [Desulfarculus sp.]
GQPCCGQRGVPRLVATSWKVLECIFQRAGYVFEREVGDHSSYSRPGTLRPIIIPKYNSVGVDIIHANMRTAGMSREEYFQHLAACK